MKVETEKLQEAIIAKKVKKAELHLLEPLARVYENRHVGNEAPCGPAGKGPTHWIGSQGSRNYITWRTLKSHQNSNCTLRIAENHETNDFRLIRPLDSSDNFDGAFPCGRKVGFHGKEIKLPNDLICESCVLQLTQEISDPKEKMVIHQCADIVILEKKTDEYISDCVNKCKNGGIC